MTAAMPSEVALDEAALGDVAGAGARGRSLGVVAGTILVFMYVPLIVVIGAAFNSNNSIAFPPEGISLRWFEAMFDDPLFRESLWTSLEISLQTSVLAAAMGTAFALAATRGRGPLFAATSALANLPMVLPGVFIGVALFTTFIFAGVPMSSRTALAGQIVYVLPFVIAITDARLRNFDVSLEEAARVSGYTRRATLLFVTLRMSAPAIAASAALAFALSFDEVYITNFIIGQDSTVPIYILAGFRRGIDPRLNAVAAVLLLVPLTALAAGALIRRLGSRSESTGGPRT